MTKTANISFRTVSFMCKIKVADVTDTVYLISQADEKTIPVLQTK